MQLLRRSVIVTGLVAVLLFAFSALALATGEEPAPEGEETEQTVVTTDIEPAVEITTPAAEAVTADWTYRYLVPTGIALAVLVVIATTGQYFTNVVRKRYRIVEE